MGRVVTITGEYLIPELDRLLSAWPNSGGRDLAFAYIPTLRAGGARPVRIVGYLWTAQDNSALGSTFEVLPTATSPAFLEVDGVRYVESPADGPPLWLGAASVGPQPPPMPADWPCDLSTVVKSSIPGTEIANAVPAAADTVLLSLFVELSQQC